jgi:SAM-dependent methyltransferase
MADGTPTEDAIRLLGRVRGKRLLELGCGTGEQAVEFARGGATVIAVDGSADHIARAREASELAEVRLELHTADLADLAFLRADSIDLAFSDGALAAMPDLGRVFRQVHRVLRHGAPFVFSLPHPVSLGTETEAGGEDGLPLGRTLLTRSYFDPGPVDVGEGKARTRVTGHTISTVFTGLVRTGFRVDNLLEPEPAGSKNARALLPAIVVWRARKEGS